MKKQFLSLIAAGLMLGGASHVKAMDSALMLAAQGAASIASHLRGAQSQNSITPQQSDTMAVLANPVRETQLQNSATPQEQLQKKYEEKARNLCMPLGQRNASRDTIRVISFNHENEWKWIIFNADQIEEKDEETGLFLGLDIYRKNVNKTPGAIIARYPISPIASDESLDAYRTRLDQEKNGLLKKHKNYTTLEMLTQTFALSNPSTEGWNLRNPYNTEADHLWDNQLISHEHFYWGPTKNPTDAGWQRAHKKAIATLVSMHVKSHNKNGDEESN